MRENRGPWYLLTGLALGLVAGLIITWMNPVRYVNTSPDSLRDDFKDRYRALIAAAFMASGDVERAQARLSLLQDADMSEALISQAQRAVVEGRPADEVNALSRLAVALGQNTAPPTAIVQPQASPVSPTPTVTPSPTPNSSPTPVVVEATAARTGSPRPQSAATNTSIPLPTRTPTATPSAPFVLQEKRMVCDANPDLPLLQVEARDAAGQPVAGVEVVVQWDDGEEHFFTGLKPEIGLGYADFAMRAGVTYAAWLGSGGEPVRNITIPECRNLGEQYPGSWLLIFAQP